MKTTKTTKKEVVETTKKESPLNTIKNMLFNIFRFDIVDEFKKEIMILEEGNNLSEKLKEFEKTEDFLTTNAEVLYLDYLRQVYFDKQNNEDKQTIKNLLKEYLQNLVNKTLKEKNIDIEQIEEKHNKFLESMNRIENNRKQKRKNIKETKIENNMLAKLIMGEITGDFETAIKEDGIEKLTNNKNNEVVTENEENLEIEETEEVLEIVENDFKEIILEQPKEILEVAEVVEVKETPKTKRTRKPKEVKEITKAEFIIAETKDEDKEIIDIEKLKLIDKRQEEFDKKVEARKKLILEIAEKQSKKEELKEILEVVEQKPIPKKVNIVDKEKLEDNNETDYHFDFEETEKQDLQTTDKQQVNYSSKIARFCKSFLKNIFSIFQTIFLVFTEEKIEKKESKKTIEKKIKMKQEYDILWNKYLNNLHLSNESLSPILKKMCEVEKQYYLEFNQKMK